MALQVSLVPRAAAAPGPAGLAAEISSMPRFYDWGGGDFSGVTVDVGVDGSDGSVAVDVCTQPHCACIKFHTFFPGSIICTHVCAYLCVVFPC